MAQQQPSSKRGISKGNTKRLARRNALIEQLPPMPLGLTEEEVRSASIGEIASLVELLREELERRSRELGTI